MTKREYEELIALINQSGLNAKLCDSPVPYFSGGVPAGYPEAPDDYGGEYVMVPKDFLKLCDFIVRVRGFSMKDAGIADGDDVMVKHSDHYDDGDVVVALLDGDSTLKAYYRDENNEEWLVPDNDDFTPIHVADFTSAYILGKVTGGEERHSPHEVLDHASQIAGSQGAAAAGGDRPDGARSGDTGIERYQERSYVVCRL